MEDKVLLHIVFSIDGEFFNEASKRISSNREEISGVIKSYLGGVLTGYLNSIYNSNFESLFTNEDIIENIKLIAQGETKETHYQLYIKDLLARKYIEVLDCIIIPPGGSL